MYIWAWLTNTLYHSSLPFLVSLLPELRQRNLNTSAWHVSVNGPFLGLDLFKKNCTSPNVPHGRGGVSKRNSSCIIWSFFYLCKFPCPVSPSPCSEHPGSRYFAIGNYIWKLRERDPIWVRMRKKSSDEMG